ncbi:MAG TPA: protein phosphatase CheZ [Xanthobacteraceae bacterium]|nr:protein phosphatase CheZ [Xanthobacteraceae bacterium]
MTGTIDPARLARQREVAKGLPTMAMANTQVLGRIAEFLRRKRADDEVTLVDVVHLAEITAESLQTFFATMDSAVYRELRGIADYIASMRQEIGALQVHELKQTRIPAAGQELDAIFKATEEATNTIMSSAEAVMAADASDAEAFKALVDAKMLDIFEACSFQDITGQRIAKVVETLQHIESRVSSFAAAVRTKDVEGAPTEREREQSERRRSLILNGPQLKGEGIQQGEVDRLFA